jgi:hypothetical protein
MMLRVALTTVALALCAACWVAGLWLFVAADLPKRRKLAWVSVLVIVGVCVGVVLPTEQVSGKFLWAVALLPLVAAADLLLFRSGRGLSYWLRACGFEVVTVFAAAAAVRYTLDVLGIGAAIGMLRR